MVNHMVSPRITKRNRICPDCGRCDRCGRGSHPGWYYPNLPVYPYYPSWYVNHMPYSEGLTSTVSSTSTTGV